MRGRDVIWLIVLVVIAVLAWPTWQAWRWGLALRVYADDKFTARAMTPAHLVALRKLQFAWNTQIESGGPVVDPLAPYGSDDMGADLGPIIGTRDRVAIARFHREVSALLIWALENSELPEGRYRLARLDNAGMEQRLRRDLAGLPPQRIDVIMSGLPRLQPDGTFRVTDQHRRLLRALRFEWPDNRIAWIAAGSGYPAPIVHFKRPFGDMSAFDIDMAAILGLPRPPNDRVDPVLDRLYWEMWPALQAFAENAVIDVAQAPRGGE